MTLILIRVNLLHIRRTDSIQLSVSVLRLSQVLLLALSAAACASPLANRHDWPSVPPVSLTPHPNPPIIVVGFVGGVVKHDNPIRSEVILAEHLRAEYPSGVYVETFENRRREKALRAILTQLGADRSGLLSENEKRQARIILYGHSWAVRRWSSWRVNLTNTASLFSLRFKWIA